jgi:hypothetical protein
MTSIIFALTWFFVAMLGGTLYLLQLQMRDTSIAMNHVTMPGIHYTKSGEDLLGSLRKGKGLFNKRISSEKIGLISPFFIQLNRNILVLVFIQRHRIKNYVRRLPKVWFSDFEAVANLVFVVGNVCLKVMCPSRSFSFLKQFPGVRILHLNNVVDSETDTKIFPALMYFIKRGMHYNFIVSSNEYTYIHPQKLYELLDNESPNQHGCIGTVAFPCNVNSQVFRFSRGNFRFSRHFFIISKATLKLLKPLWTPCSKKKKIDLILCNITIPTDGWCTKKTFANDKMLQEGVSYRSAHKTIAISSNYHNSENGKFFCGSPAMSKCNSRVRMDCQYTLLKAQHCAMFYPIQGNEYFRYLRYVLSRKIEPPALPGKYKCSLAIGVFSHPNSMTARAAIRATWGKIARVLQSIQLFFVLGSTSSVTIQNLLTLEQTMHHDLVVTNLSESSKNRHLKFLKWIAYATHFTNCTAIFNTSDASYVRVLPLLSHIRFAHKTLNRGAERSNFSMFQPRLLQSPFTSTANHTVPPKKIENQLVLMFREELQKGIYRFVQNNDLECFLQKQEISMTAKRCRKIILYSKDTNEKHPFQKFNQVFESDLWGIMPQKNYGSMQVFTNDETDGKTLPYFAGNLKTRTMMLNKHNLRKIFLSDIDPPWVNAKGTYNGASWKEIKNSDFYSGKQNINVLSKRQASVVRRAIRMGRRQVLKGVKICKGGLDAVHVWKITNRWDISDFLVLFKCMKQKHFENLVVHIPFRAALFVPPITWRHLGSNSIILVVKLMCFDSSINSIFKWLRSTVNHFPWTGDLVLLRTDQPPSLVPKYTLFHSELQQLNKSLGKHIRIGVVSNKNINLYMTALWSERKRSLASTTLVILDSLVKPGPNFVLQSRIFSMMGNFTFIPGSYFKNSLNQKKINNFPVSYCFPGTDMNINALKTYRDDPFYVYRRDANVGRIYTEELRVFSSCDQL